MFLYDAHAVVSVGTRECASAEWSTGVLVDQQGVVIKRLTLSMLHQSNQRDPQHPPPPINLAPFTLLLSIWPTCSTHCQHLSRLFPL